MMIEVDVSGAQSIQEHKMTVLANLMYVIQERRLSLMEHAIHAEIIRS
jgi:uncharacterized protein YigA (DUF484 family)